MNIRKLVSITALVLISMVSHAQEERNLIFILDVSNSMWGQIEKGRPKIDLAKEALIEQIWRLPRPGPNVGLIAYGHRNKKSCTDIEVLTDVGPLNREDISSKIQKLRPTGRTPMTAAISLAVQTLKGKSGHNTIVLISDGEESCDLERDPCDVIRDLRRQYNFDLEVIGFDIVNESVAIQLSCMAETGGGRYTAAATGSSLDIAVGVATGNVDADTVQANVVHENIQLVMDRSQSMAGQFTGSGTRLEAALRALQNVLDRRLMAADRENFSFRYFGGDCDDRKNNTHLAVGWGMQNSGTILNELGRLNPHGQTTLVDAITMAIKDFDTITADGVNRRVVIVAGDVNLCPGPGESLLRQKLQAAKIIPEFRFIGIGVPPDRQDRYFGIVAATNGAVVFVDNEEDLNIAFERFLEYEPAKGDIDSIVASVNAGIVELNNAMTKISAGRYSSAEEILAKIPEAMAESVKPYEDLSRRRKPIEYAQLFDNMSKLSTLQEQLMEVVAKMLESHRSEDIALYNAELETFTEHLGSYNKNVDVTNKTLGSLNKRFNQLQLMTVDS